MLIKIGFDIEFALGGPTPMVLMLFVHPSRRDDLRGPESEPERKFGPYYPTFGNRCARLPGAPTCASRSDMIGPRRTPIPIAERSSKDRDCLRTVAFLILAATASGQLTEVAWQLFARKTPAGHG